MIYGFVLMTEKYRGRKKRVAHEKRCFLTHWPCKEWWIGQWIGWARQTNNFRFNGACWQLRTNNSLKGHLQLVICLQIGREGEALWSHWHYPDSHLVLGETSGRRGTKEHNVKALGYGNQQMFTKHFSTWKISSLPLLHFFLVLLVSGFT